jgi:hypothetical protein
MNKAAAILCLLCLSLLQRALAAPAWIEQASNPGPDVPPIGQSRFDQLFLDPAEGYRIPYPFSRLIETLESGLDNGNNPAVRQVLIPMGRSLQRDTPAPDYFHFPREVIAIEGEPVTSGRDAGMVMEYRLFIAHQPRTETLEVISYNDAAGRFEFQVVDDYAADAKPRARPANRVMCMSCHHNAAPIFPVTPWRETSFNVEVAKRLVAARPDRYGSLIGLITLDAGVIDVLIERANYLSATQTVWQDGCTSIRCRAAMLRTALQFRLSGESSFDLDSPRYRLDYSEELSRNWQLRWPDGLALPGSRLTDRSPFSDDAYARNHDPLLPRPAQAIWNRVDETLARGIIYRLAGFFTLADIRRIDQSLDAASRRNSLQTYRHAANCRVRGDDLTRAHLVCGENGGSETLQAVFEIDFSSDSIESLRVLSLKLPHDTNLLQPDIVALSQFPGRLEAIPGNGSLRLSSRLANGDRIDSIRLQWKDSLRDVESSLEIRFSREFEIIDEALSRLVAAHEAGTASSLSAGVFRRKPVLQELMQVLGLEALQWQPTAATESRQNRLVTTGPGGGLALLEPYCGHCHGDATSNPPGFLAGAAPEKRILQCAPRILSRLKAWQRESNLPLSPMPPPASIEYSGVSAHEWASSDHYRTLVASLEQLLADRSGHQDLEDSRHTDYDRLPPCLASANE